MTNQAYIVVIQFYFTIYFFLKLLEDAHFKSYCYKLKAMLSFILKVTIWVTFSCKKFESHNFIFAWIVLHKNYINIKKNACLQASFVMRVHFIMCTVQEICKIICGRVNNWSEQINKGLPLLEWNNLLHKQSVLLNTKSNTAISSSW